MVLREPSFSTMHPPVHPGLGWAAHGLRLGPGGLAHPQPPACTLSAPLGDKGRPGPWPTEPLQDPSGFCLWTSSNPACPNSATDSKPHVQVWNKEPTWEFLPTLPEPNFTSVEPSSQQIYEAHQLPWEELGCRPSISTYLLSSPYPATPRTNRVTGLCLGFLIYKMGT